MTSAQQYDCTRKQNRKFQRAWEVGQMRRTRLVPQPPAGSVYSHDGLVNPHRLAWELEQALAQCMRADMSLSGSPKHGMWATTCTQSCLRSLCEVDCAVTVVN